MSPASEIIDPSVVRTEITAYLGNVLEQAQAISQAVRDEASANEATSLGVAVKSRLKWLREKRADVYEPLYRATERVRQEYDEPIKLGNQLEKTLAAAVVKFRLDVKREEERLRLQAEADARRIREEAARKEREAEAERQRIIREREVREQRARDEAAAEERRKLAEIEAGKKAERERLASEQAERARRIKEEEDARIARAQEAQDVGLPERVDGILERPTPVAEVVKALPTAAENAAKAERERREQEEREAAEKKRQADADEETRIRNEETQRLAKMQDDAARANSAADAAESMAASQVSVSAEDGRLRTSGSYKYALDDEAGFRRLVKAVADNRAPIGWLNFDPDHPEKFRSTMLGKYVVKLRQDPDASAKIAELAALGVRAWLQEGGTLNADDDGVL